MLEAVATFFVYIVESFTGSVIENSATARCRRASSDDAEGQALLQVGENLVLSDFTDFDPDDDVFQEFVPPDRTNGKMAWKLSRPPFLKSVLTCFKAVLMMQLLLGLALVCWQSQWQ